MSHDPAPRVHLPTGGLSAPPLLQVEDLTVTFPGPAGVVRAVDGVSFSLRRGERLGLAGESGAGKSLTALSLLRLVPEPPATIGGRIEFDGQDLSTASPRALRHVRGGRIAMIFQDPHGCLSPRLSIGAQLVEAVRAHRRVSRRQARERAVDLLGQVGIPAPRVRAREYPHRLSGGMAQRVMIAMALAGEPELIIADEPTTALDVSIEAQIVELLAALCQDRGTAVLFITHDLGILARFADRIAVMYAGRIVETGPVDAVYDHPTHPYTAGLLAATARPDSPSRGRLDAIPGSPPEPSAIPDGCAFHPRCPHAIDRCVHDTPTLQARPDRCASACHRAHDLSFRPTTSGRTP